MAERTNKVPLNWSAPLVLAEGTYASGAVPAIDFSSTQIFVQVLPVVPEPGSTLLAVIASLGLVRLARRHR